MRIPILSSNSTGRKPMDPISESEVRKLRRLMEGTTMDKDRAEVKLKDFDPAILPEGILECWTCGSTFDKFRAGRVKESWKTIQVEEPGMA